MVLTQGQIGGGIATLMSRAQRWLGRSPQPPTAAQLAQAAKEAQAATRQALADEATRAQSRRVMLALWPPRPGAPFASAPAEPPLPSRPVQPVQALQALQAHETLATLPSAANRPLGRGPYWGRFTACSAPTGGAVAGLTASGALARKGSPPVEDQMGDLMGVQRRVSGGVAGGARRWLWRGWVASPLLVLSLACGLGLYWAATQVGWLTAGWGPAIMTTSLYLIGLAAIMGAMTGAGALGQRLLDRTFPALRAEAGGST